MNRRRVLVALAVLLAAQLALIGLSHFRSAGSAEAPLLAKALESHEIAKLVLGGTTGAPATLTLQRSGDSWTLTEEGEYPADGARVQDLLRRLSTVKASRPISTDRAYHAALGVDDQGAQSRLRVYAPGSGEPFLDLLFGTSSEPRSSTVRHAGQDDVWELYGLPAWEFRPDAAPWMERPFVSFEPDAVTAIVVSAGGKQTRLRLGEGGWSIESAGAVVAADATKVAELIRTAATLSPTAPAGKTGGKLPAGSVREVELRLTMKDGSETILELGGTASSPRVEVATPGFPFAASFWRSSVEPILSAGEATLRAD